MFVAFIVIYCIQLCSIVHIIAEYNDWKDFFRPFENIFLTMKFLLKLFFWLFQSHVFKTTFILINYNKMHNGLIFFPFCKNQKVFLIRFSTLHFCRVKRTHHEKAVFIKFPCLHIKVLRRYKKEQTRNDYKIIYSQHPLPLNLDILLWCSSFLRIQCFWCILVKQMPGAISSVRRYSIWILCLSTASRTRWYRISMYLLSL